MRRPNQTNLKMVREVATAFGDLREEVVFVGGAIVDFLITDPASPEVRASMDVDVIIELASQMDYHALRGPLNSLGFKEDNSGNPPLICRWNINGIIVDIMPTDEKILGFSNEWYMDAIKTADWVEIAEKLSIRRISGPSFLMTKLAAFNDRGNEDYLGSSDIEDVIAVLDGRPGIIDEIKGSHQKLKNALVQEFRALLKNQDFMDALPGHLIDNHRSPTIIKRLQTIVGTCQ
jgi:predicted nucleotidyltransferase